MSSEINSKLEQLLEMNRKETEQIAALQKQADQSTSRIAQLAKKVVDIEDKLAKSKSCSPEAIKVSQEISVHCVCVYFVALASLIMCLCIKSFITLFAM